MHPQALQLNNRIKKANPVIYDLLSRKGREIFIPKEGILAQTAEVRDTKINATIGQAITDNGNPMHLPSISRRVKLNPKDVFLYAPFAGKPELRNVWLNKIKRDNPSLKTTISTPVITCGITHGLSVAGLLFIDPGNEVILADKFWPNYKAIFEPTYGASLRTFNTFTGGGLDTKSFGKTLATAKTSKKIILFNFPGNPAGYTPSPKEVNAIVKILMKDDSRNNKIAVICDDAYAGLTYTKTVYKESIFARLADLHRNILAVKLDGATKEQYAWGLRVGFITFGSKGISEDTCNALEEKATAGIRSTISNVPHISQSLLLSALQSPTHKKEQYRNYKILKERFEKMKQILHDKKFLEVFIPLPTNSGYFTCLELKPGINPQKLRQTLFKKYNTGVIVMENMVRVAFSSVPAKDMRQLFENIYAAAKKQQGNK